MNCLRSIFSLLMLCALSACVRLGPNFRPPEVPQQEEWLEQESPFTAQSDDDELYAWWTLFEDPLLDQCVDIALKGNFTVHAAAFRILQARANLGFAIGEYFPQTQQLEGSSFRTQLSANAPNTLTADRHFLDSILGGRIAWELDFWGRFYRGVESAWDSYIATEDDYRDVQRILVSDVAASYILYKTSLDRIATLRRNAKTQERSVEIAKVRWQEGYESELDHAQASALWKDTLAQVNAAEIDLKLAATSLAVLLGLTPQESQDLLGEISSTPMQLPDEVAIGFPAEILTRRPDLQRTLHLLGAQCAQIGIAITNLYPRISFTGFLGLECASDTHSTANLNGKHLFSRNSLTFFYGPDFVWPILNYNRLTNQVIEQYAKLNEGIAIYRNQVLEAYKEVEDALTTYVKSLEETANLVDSVKHGERAVSISMLQYHEGLADFTRVLNSLQLQLSEEDKLSVVRGQTALGLVSIYRALGSQLYPEIEQGLCAHLNSAGTTSVE